MIYNDLSTKKWIGKTLLDKSGITENLGGTNNESIHLATKVNEDKITELKKDIESCNTTAQVDVVIKEHGLSDIEGVPEHVKELYINGETNNIEKEDINSFIATQNNKNIAEQAHGFVGVNNAIEKYKELSDVGAKNKLADEIKNTNQSLGNYLSNLDNAKAGYHS